MGIYAEGIQNVLKTQQRDLVEGVRRKLVPVGRAGSVPASPTPARVPLSVDEVGFEQQPSCCAQRALGQRAFLGTVASSL